MWWPQSWIAAASPARSAGRSRALTSTTVVRVDARSASATDGATSNALVRRCGWAPGSGGACAPRPAGPRQRRGLRTRQGGLDRAGQAVAQAPVGIGLPAAIEHEQIVERHAVAGG